MSSSGYKVIVDNNRCTGCAQCYAVCPNKVFIIKNMKAIPEYQDRCVGCRACVIKCPSAAITLMPRDVHAFFARFYSK